MPPLRLMEVAAEAAGQPRRTTHARRRLPARPGWGAGRSRSLRRSSVLQWAEAPRGDGAGRVDGVEPLRACVELLVVERAEHPLARRLHELCALGMACGAADHLDASA